jgi:Flp pilus assembly secretin CpaC
VLKRQKTLIAFAALASQGYAATTMAGETAIRLERDCGTQVTLGIVAAGLAISPTRAGMDIEAARPSVTLELGAGSTVVLERPFKTVLIGNPDVIDVQTQSERSVLLKPLSPGATNLVFVDEQGIVIINLTIVVRNARAI